MTLTAVDYVRFQCPVCSRVLVAQSKAGPCRFIDFNSSSVPTQVAADIDGKKVACGCAATFYVSSYLPHKVRCVLVSADDADKTMPCLNCRSRLIPAKEDITFDTGIVLVGISVYRCSSCGDEETSIPRLAGLLSCLQREKQRPVRLTPGVDW